MLSPKEFCQPSNVNQPHELALRSITHRSTSRSDRCEVKSGKRVITLCRVFSFQRSQERMTRENNLLNESINVEQKILRQHIRQQQKDEVGADRIFCISLRPVDLIKFCVEILYSRLCFCIDATQSKNLFKTLGVLSSFVSEKTGLNRMFGGQQNTGGLIK